MIQKHILIHTHTHLKKKRLFVKPKSMLKKSGIIAKMKKK